MKGLRKTAAAKLHFAAAHDARAEEERNPADAHDARRAAIALRAEAAAMVDLANANDELIAEIETLANYLEASPAKSCGRAIALTKLEEALMWLQRENGGPV